MALADAQLGAKTQFFVLQSQDEVLVVALNASPMKRDDLLFWLSLVWFAGMCGAAAWALLAPWPSW